MNSLGELQNEDEPFINTRYKRSRAKTFCMNDCNRYFNKSKKLGCLLNCNYDRFKI